MKNNNLKEIKPIYIQDTSPQNDNELSLIDLALILVKHKKMIVLVILLFFILGVAKSLMSTKSYTFNTSIEIGSQVIDGVIQPFESSETLLAKLQFSFIPQSLIEYYSSSNEQVRYKINSHSPQGSNIIILDAIGAEAEARTLSELLLNITQKIITDHNRIHLATQQRLKAIKSQAESELELLSSNKDNQDEKKRLLRSRIDVYSSQLANLRQTRQIFPPIKSHDSVSKSGKVIVTIFTLIGIFVAVFISFFAEFVIKVREKSKSSNS